MVGCLVRYDFNAALQGGRGAVRVGSVAQDHSRGHAERAAKHGQRGGVVNAVAPPLLEQIGDDLEVVGPVAVRRIERIGKVTVCKIVHQVAHDGNLGCLPRGKAVCVQGSIGIAPYGGNLCDAVCARGVDKLLQFIWQSLV